MHDVQPRLFLSLLAHLVSCGVTAAGEPVSSRATTQRACRRVMDVLDEELMHLDGSPESRPRVPRAHERTFHDLPDECARVGPEIGARFFRQCWIFLEEEAPKRLLVCKSDGRPPGVGCIAVACIERGRHVASLAGVTTRSDGANMRGLSGDVTSRGTFGAQGMPAPGRARVPAPPRL